MIFKCVTKSVKPPFLARDDGIRQQPPSQFQKQTNCLFCIKLLSENQKETLLTPYLKGQLKPRVSLELPLLSRIRREKSERDRLSPPTVAKRKPCNYVESFDKAEIQHNTILHCEETLADSKYSEFSLGWGSVISRECGDLGSALVC